MRCIDGLPDDYQVFGFYGFQLFDDVSTQIEESCVLGRVKEEVHGF